MGGWTVRRMMGGLVDGLVKTGWMPILVCMESTMTAQVECRW